tara:strand:+ start:36 stop:341 length:306 start_codon:yes stop_codon:yes gene_type:complete
MKKLLLIIGCEENSTEFEMAYGCKDPSACNFDTNATINLQETCLYFDCVGDCGGSAILDVCNECNGSATSDEYVLLWDVCYNIAETNSLDISGYFLKMHPS